MSIVAMKRRAGATIGVSAGPEGRFSLQGNRRLPPTFVDRPSIASSSMMMISTEDATVPKRACMSNAGMLASRFPKSAFTTVKRSLTDFSHQDYLDHIKRQRIALCPDPAVKEVAPPHCVDTQTGGSCISQLRCLERAWSLAASAAPNMPGKTGARDYSEWLAGAVACSYKLDVYSSADIRAARAIAEHARAVADAAERAKQIALDALEAARQEQVAAEEELAALEAAYHEAELQAQIAEDAAAVAQAFLDSLVGTAGPV